MSKKLSEAVTRAVMVKAHLIPQEPYRSIHAPWKCICTKCKRVVTPTYTQVRTRGRGCKYCAKIYVDPKEAVAFMLSKGLKPKERYKGAMSPWKSKCLTCGKVVTPTYSNVRTGHSGCRHCAHKITVFKRTKTKSQVFAYLRSQGYAPVKGAAFVSSEVTIKCKHLPCGRIVQARYFTVQQGRGCCNHCGTREGAKKWARTLDEVQPILNKKKITLLEKKLLGMRQKHLLQCKKCNLIWKARLASVTSDIGCPNCALYGLKPNLKSYIYLIQNKELGSIKLGIANSNKPRDRVDKHIARGWEIYKLKTFVSGTKARSVETECLKYFRVVKGIPPHLSKSKMPQGGWTETFDARIVKPSTIWAKVEQLGRVGK